MKESGIIEVAGLWKRGDGRYSSGSLMDDRVQDLCAMMQEGPVKLMVRPNERRRSTKSPDAVLLALPIGQRTK